MGGEIAETVRKVYGDFLDLAGFDPQPRPCTVCGLWYQSMVLRTCSCREFSYCGTSCYNSHWEAHQRSCPAAASSRRTRCENMIVEKFKMFDKNGDGKIDR